LPSLCWRRAGSSYRASVTSLVRIWWAPAALGAAAVSIVLLILTFTPWWLLALVIDAAIAVVAWRAIRS